MPTLPTTVKRDTRFARNEVDTLNVDYLYGLSHRLPRVLLVNQSGGQAL